MSDKIRTHKDLKVWQRSVELVTRVYKITVSFPKFELFRFISHIYIDAVSIPSNIADGSGRRSPNELIQFLHKAIGSIEEFETQIIIDCDYDYVQSNCYQ